MDLSKIISISGKPGLYKVVAQSKSNIIVESLDNKKRFPAYSTDRISALEDISIYTYEDDVPLKEVYTIIAKKENCGAILSHKESLKKLTTYLDEVFPDYDEDRVYPSDIKKLFQWYNTLQKSGFITLEEEQEKKEGKEKEQKKETKTTDKSKTSAKPKAKTTKKVQSTTKKKTAKKTSKTKEK